MIVCYPFIVRCSFRIGKVSYNIALGLTEFLRSDFEYVPWQSALDVLEYFNSVLGRSKAYGAYSV